MKDKAANISTTINDLSEQEHRWFAIYTKYKCEKHVVDQLSRKDIAAYVPLVTVTKRYTSKVKRYEVPLINSYAFVRIVKSQYVQVLETEHVYSFIKQRKNLISIPQAEIDILKMVVGEIENVQVGEFTLATGDEVEIISGNLTGIRGRLIEKEGKNTFTVQLTSVGLQLEMLIDSTKLRLVRRGARG